MGMSLFFALSGFLIASTLLHNPDIHEFLVRRFAQGSCCSPTHMLFFVFTFLDFDPKALFWTASFLLNYFLQYMVDGYNNHFWSLCVEMQFYLAIALIVLVAGQKGVWAVWPACLAVTALRVTDGAYISIQTHVRVDEILAGACVATLESVLRWTPNRSHETHGCARGARSPVLWFACSKPLFRMAAVSEALRYGFSVGSCSFLWKNLPSVRARLTGRCVISRRLPMHSMSYTRCRHTDGSIRAASSKRYLLKRPISFLITFATAHVSTFYWERWWIAGRAEMGLTAARASISASLPQHISQPETRLHGQPLAGEPGPPQRSQMRP